MKCISCSIDISPSLKYCYTNNICGSCGEKIMDEPTINLLTELKEAMLKMPNDPEGLAGWLVSNYNLSKVGDAEPIEFFNPRKKGQRKSCNDESEEEELDYTVNEKGQFFLNRTEIMRGDKVQQLRNKMQKARSGAYDNSNIITDPQQLEAEIDASLGPDEGVGDFSAAMLNQQDLSDLANEPRVPIKAFKKQGRAKQGDTANPRFDKILAEQEEATKVISEGGELKGGFRRSF